MRGKIWIVLLGALLAVNCNLVDWTTAELTPSPTTPLETPAVHMRLIEATSFKASAEIAVNAAAQITIISEPVFYSFTRTDDDRVGSSSMRPWQDHNLSQMRTCLSLDEPCTLSSSDWQPFAEEQQIEIGVDWLGPRHFFWDENTPLESLPPPLQTAVATTQSAHPLSGSVFWQGGSCCASGVAGETIDLQAQFSAESPSGRVTEMRAAAAGVCFDEARLSDIPWEPFAPEKSYPVQVVLNWVGHYISVQYRDERGNLSPVYCDDISVEGSPSPSANP
ncbi:MAG: hypothetical protein JXA78_14965 [Anaerolineales bacterium]|nr:hypothetical protein [Anaerolineales bacterium]